MTEHSEGKCKLLVRRTGAGGWAVRMCKVLLLEFGIKMAEVYELYREKHAQVRA
jgi:hypothetical protein